MLPLSEHDSLELFSRERVPSDLVQKAIVDCNGHPRSLDILHQTCQKHEWNFLTYSELFEDINQSALQMPPFCLVKSVLRANTVLLKDVLEGMTFEEYIKDGILINALAGEPVMLEL